MALNSVQSLSFYVRCRLMIIHFHNLTFIYLPSEVNLGVVVVVAANVLTCLG